MITPLVNFFLIAVEKPIAIWCWISLGKRIPVLFKFYLLLMQTE